MSLPDAVDRDAEQFRFSWTFICYISFNVYWFKALMCNLMYIVSILFFLLLLWCWKQISPVALITSIQDVKEI